MSELSRYVWPINVAGQRGRSTGRNLGWAEKAASVRQKASLLQRDLQLIWLNDIALQGGRLFRSAVQILPGFSQVQQCLHRLPALRDDLRTAVGRGRI